LEQDDHVCDTWFIKGLFFFFFFFFFFSSSSVFAEPNNAEDCEAFYPTTLLEPEADILCFCVARMVKMGLTATGCTRKCGSSPARR
jgi:valyl-tRNA synthetase